MALFARNIVASDFIFFWCSKIDTSASRIVMSAGTLDCFCKVATIFSRNLNVSESVFMHAVYCSMVSAMFLVFSVKVETDSIVFTFGMAVSGVAGVASGTAAGVAGAWKW